MHVHVPCLLNAARCVLRTHCCSEMPAYNASSCVTIVHRRCRVVGAQGATLAMKVVHAAEGGPAVRRERAGFALAAGLSDVIQLVETFNLPAAPQPPQFSILVME